MRLLKIGNQIINADAIANITFDPAATNPATCETWAECVVSFGCDDCCVFYGADAVQVWQTVSQMAISIAPTVPEFASAI